jgi:alpha-beta hydrolase superfamily lysophospholipase
MSNPHPSLPRCPWLAPVLLALVAIAQPGAAFAPHAMAPLGTVVLLHGLGRSADSMRLFERALAARGYAVCNPGYPSTRASVAELAGLVAEEVSRCRAGSATPLHFVSHSLGGIVVRAYVREHRPANLGRVVMLAPPNAGTEWVDAFRDTWLFSLAGPAARELGTDAHSVPRRLGPVDFEVGVLIGDRSWNPLGSWLIPGDDDGTVAVASARVEGMADFRVVHENHGFIVTSPRVVWQAIHFLEHGSFDEDAREE